MANLIAAIDNLKRLLQDRDKKKSAARAAATATARAVDPSKEEWEHKCPSTWASMFKYIPILFGIGREGAVVMYVKAGRGKQSGYIYPRVPFDLFSKWMSKNARGGQIYWGKGFPALKEYSVAARRVGKKIVVKGRIGAKQVRMRGIAFPTTKVSRTSRAVTMYRQIPRSVRIHP